jgi:hypothetical protein
VLFLIILPAFVRPTSFALLINKQRSLLLSQVIEALVALKVDLEKRSWFPFMSVRS